MATEDSVEVVMETPSLQPPVTFVIISVIAVIIISVTIIISVIIIMLKIIMIIGYTNKCFRTFLLFDPIAQNFPKKYTNMIIFIDNLKTFPFNLISQNYH